MVSVTASDGCVRVRLKGSDAAWALKRRLDVPLGAVTEVRVADDASRWLGVSGRDLGLRLPGTYVPGVITAGSFWWKTRGWTFCCLRRGQRALVIDVAPGDIRYRRLVLGVEDPDAARACVELARCGGNVAAS